MSDDLGGWVWSQGATRLVGKAEWGRVGERNKANTDFMKKKKSNSASN